MKWMVTILFISLVSLFGLSAWAQLLEENFSYTAGTNLTDNGWTAHGNLGQNPITVASSGLSYSGYPSSGIGNAALLDGPNGQDEHRTFTSQTAGTTIYASFLVNVTSATISGDYFFHLGASTIGSTFVGRVYAQQNGSGNLEFGLLKSATGSATYTTNNYSFGTTYLLVLKYLIVTGAGNDEASLFVFTSGVPSSEPGTPTVGSLTTGTDPTNIGSVALRQGGATTAAVVTVDGIRIGTSWGDAPLPVELSSFTAAAGNGVVTLRWVTQSEVNNERFDVLRAQERNGVYQVIGSRPGQGNSNAPTPYSFTDNLVANGSTYWYKIADVDVNGVRTEHGPVSATPQAAGTEIITLNSDAPANFKIYPAYPNPFNPSTNLKFDIPAGSQGLQDVKVEIYNTIGQKIRTLFEGIAEPATHSLAWDGADDNGQIVPGGVYFAVLTTGHFRESVKLTLVK